MSVHKHLPEEIIVDYVLNQLRNEERKRVAMHLERCHRCQNIVAEWNVLLKTETEPTFSTDAIKERLFEHIRKDRRRKQRKLIPRFVVAATTAAILFLVLSLSAYKDTIQRPDYVVSKNDEIPLETIQTSRYTHELNIVPVREFPHVNGHVRVNADTNEMLLEVSGLYVFPNRDYQLWIIYSDDQIVDEIIPVENGSTRMFFKGVEVAEFKMVKASVEPRGGSKQQTGPETFIVDF